MSLLNLGEDTWIREYVSCEKLYRDIMGLLSQRQREPKTTTHYSQLSASVRLYLKQYNNEVTQLKEKLDHISKTQLITYDEIERRVRQIEILKSKGINLKKVFDTPIRTLEHDRDQLLGTAGGSSWDSDEQLIEKPGGVGDIISQHKRLLEDQEKGLENLSKIISRQKNIAQTITTEVSLQNEIIEDLGEHMDRTDGRINTETKHVSIIGHKDNTCMYWITIHTYATEANIHIGQKSLRRGVK